MTDITNDASVDMENDLDAFEDVFFGRVDPEEKTEEKDEEVSETELETEEDDAEAEDTVEDEDQEEKDEEPKEEPKSEKKGRKSFKERIDELTAEKYEARREVDALRQELEQLRVRPKEEVHQEQALKETLPPEAPQPDAVDAKGEPVYALGEFDPKFIRDITRYTIEQEMKEVQKQQELAARQRTVQLQQETLRTHWNENLTEAEKELPDIREKLKTVATAFQQVEPSYGEYLAGVIMSCENGPEIMYYLSNNIGEAQKIVASGPAAATLAIGRLEARLEKSNSSEDKRDTKRVSTASKPPEARSRGTGGKFTVAPDTNDLDAFERVFFERPKKQRPF